MPIAAAVPAIISGGSSIVGSIIGSKGAKSAAQIQQDNALKMAQMARDEAQKSGASVSESAGRAAKSVQEATGAGINRVDQSTGNANDVLGGVLGKETANLDPYLKAGQQGLEGLTQGYAPGGQFTKQFEAPNPNDISNTPEYQFQLQEGMKALTRAAAATGSLGTGGTLKAITRYGQGLASTSYQQAYNNALTTFGTNRSNAMNGLMALTNIGQGATTNYQGALENFGNRSSTNDVNAGLFAGNSILNAGTYSGNADIGATQFGANLNMDSTKEAMAALTQGAQAQSAGRVAQANAWQGGLGGIANAATNYDIMRRFPIGGGYNPGINYGPPLGSGVPPGIGPALEQPPIEQPQDFG